MLKKIILISIVFIQCLTVKAQDAHLSLYDAAPLFLNPAMTGVFKGNWRLHGQYRTQWKSVNYRPYQTGLISFDIPYKKWGFGVQVSNFRAGIGNYNSLQGTVSAAYTTAVDKRKNHNISFGLQGGVTQKTIEYQLLSYNNQYTTTNGGEFNQTIDAVESFSGQSMLTPVLNAGFMYFYAKEESRLNPFIGVSAFNLTTPQETFFDQDNRLPIRYYAHAGTRINFTELFYVIPKVLIMQQEEFWEQSYALDAGYYLKGSDMYLIGGVVYRAKDAMIVSVGAKMENVVAKIGYDINVSSLSTSSTGRGGFEISVTYINQKKKPSTDKICPRL